MRGEAKSKHALIQKCSDIKYKKQVFFLIASKEQHKKITTNRNHCLYERGRPLLNVSLFMIKFDSLSQIYFLKQ